MSTATQEQFQEEFNSKTEDRQQLSKVGKGIVVVGAASTIVAIGFAAYANIVMSTAVSVAVVLVFIDTMSISFVGVLGTACLAASYEALSQIF